MLRILIIIGLFLNEQNATIQKHKKTMRTFISVQNKSNIYENMGKNERIVSQTMTKKSKRNVFGTFEKEVNEACVFFDRHDEHFSR